MTSTIYNIAFDCADPYELARFWADVTGGQLSEEDAPGDPEASVTLSNGSHLFFQRVPEPKTGKNRLHLCLRPEQSRDLEVERLVQRGATVEADHRADHGKGWMILLDPEGNEFCVLRSGIGRSDAI
ncbi:MAG TPA: VOC family protein [Actinopolymorphaceae bacterium]